MTRKVGYVATALALLASGCRSEADQTPINIHQVDWSSVTLPDRVCGATRPIHLNRGKAVADSQRWSELGYSHVHVDSVQPPHYGDLDDDGQDEAALDVVCSNGGGTAGGILGYADIIFTEGPLQPKVVGIVTPQKKPPTGPATLLSVTLRSQTIVANESWHVESPFPRPCCIHGRAVTTWKYSRGTLRPIRIVVTTIGAWSKNGNLLPVRTVVTKSLESR